MAGISMDLWPNGLTNALDNARMHQRVKTEFDLLTGHKYRLDDH